MNQNNDKCNMDDRSEMVNNKLKQIRSRVFGEDKLTNYRTSINKPPHPTINLQSTQTSTKKHHRSASNNQKENYYCRIKNIDMLGVKIKEMLQHKIQNNLHHSQLEQTNHISHTSTNVHQLTPNNQYPINQHKPQFSKNRQSTNHKQSTNPARQPTNPKQPANPNKQPTNPIDKFTHLNDIQSKLMELRINRAKIKQELGLKEIQVKQVKNKQPKQLTNKQRIFLKQSQINTLIREKRQSHIFKQLNNHNQQPTKNNRIQNLEEIKQVQSVQIKKQQLPSDQKNQTIKLAQKLGQQISFDQKMKADRTTFTLINDDSKWTQLQKQLHHHKIYKDVDELKLQLIMSTEQHNPFDEVNAKINDVDCVKKLANTYQQSSCFWQENLIGCVSIKKLQSQSFTIKDIDLNKKGFLSIEDIVCFVNLYSGNFFRNRDVILMYRRFLKGKKSNLTYEDFLSVVTCD